MISIMKKLFILFVMCFAAHTMQAQRCAVLEFKAGVGISQNNVDGISAIFITYFQPAGYTMVERTQIDKVIEEQGFQRSKMTQAQMVRVGQILNVSKIVVGDINVVAGQYNVDTRVINVETGTISATEGATFATSSYRTSMQSIATKLASKIAITPGTPVKAPPSSTTSKRRNEVEVLYGYLKIFPNELGVFQAEPISVIAQINKQAQHGYNNWRIPTDEELSLMKANNYLGSGEYMTRENKKGIVLLVTDGDDFQSVQAKEKERLAELARIKAEKEHLAEQARIKAERRAQLIDEGWKDLGLPSGTLWKSAREDGLYTYDQAITKYGEHMPTAEQAKELLDNCSWQDKGAVNLPNRATGPNGNTIYFSDKGMDYKVCDGKGYHSSDSQFWTVTLDETNEDKAKIFKVDSAWMQPGEPNRKLYSRHRCDSLFVRLVYKL